MDKLATIDIVVFIAFIAMVMAVALLAGRTKGKHKDAQDFFLAGRGLKWWLIGFSLIAANISTEQFVGMSGASASHVGLAIASYEWMAAITLVVVAFAFLPYFLRAGIYTMPEFLEVRYNAGARAIMAIFTVLIYMLLLGAVTYSGAVTMQTLLGKAGISIGLIEPSLVIALIAMIYVVTGGLKASVWADLVQGTALIIGGGVIMYFAFKMLGAAETVTTITDISTGEVGTVALDPAKSAMERFTDLNSNRLNMFLPGDDKVLPWTALCLGLWIPNFYYWGLNQYITQRTLGSSSLAEGQKGIVFSAFLKLLIPFIVVIPGIIAFNLFAGDMRLEARNDVAKAMAMYAEANPKTQFVTVQQAPDDAAIEAFSGPGYVLAVYENEEAIKELEAENPHVLPVIQKDLEAFKGSVATYQLFDAKEDRSWSHVNADLAVEVAAYNKATESAAKKAGAATDTQALTAFKYDTALGQLLGEVLPAGSGLIGFVLAALLGAVISSLAAMLNAASSIFTLDIYRKFVAPNASQGSTVLIGRVAVVTFAVVAAVLSPALSNPNLSNSIFTIIQKGQGVLSPGILAIFAFGLIVRRAPRMCGVAGLVTNVICYGGLWYTSEKTKLFEGIDFLNNFLNWMAISLGVCLVVMTLMTLIRPLKEPMKFEAKTDLDLKGSKGAMTAGIVCVILTLVLYVIFSPLVIAK